MRPSCPWHSLNKACYQPLWGCVAGYSNNPAVEGMMDHSVPDPILLTPCMISFLIFTSLLNIIQNTYSCQYPQFPPVLNTNFLHDYFLRPYSPIILNSFWFTSCNLFFRLSYHIAQIILCNHYLTICIIHRICSVSLLTFRCWHLGLQVHLPKDVVKRVLKSVGENPHPIL